jgi:hypothetical protein
MLIRPPVDINIFGLKDTAAGVVHTTGVYTSPTDTTTAATEAAFQRRGIFDRCFLDLQTYTGSSDYTGWVKIKAEGIRKIDGTTLHLGEAWYFVDPSNSNTRTTVAPRYADAAWQSWNNDGVTDAIDTGLGSYIWSSDLQPDGNFTFCHSAFAWREKDPIYGVQFLGKYSLLYSVTIEFNTRRESKITTENTYTVLTKRDSFTSSTTNATFANINDGKSGRTAATVARFHNVAANSPCNIYIDPINDYMVQGTYVNETSGNQLYFSSFSEYMKDNTDVTKAPFNQVNWMPRTLNTEGVTPTLSNTMSSVFVVDESDPGNGGFPTFYHNGAWNGTAWQGRRLGWSSVGRFMATTETNYNDVDASGTEDGYNTLTGFPIFTSSGSGNYAITTTNITYPRFVHPAVRIDNRPIVGIGIVGGNYALGFNMNVNGTYANPNYSTRLLFGSGTDTATLLRAGNELSLPAEIRVTNARCYTAHSDGVEWIYGSGGNPTSRFVYRMRFTGTAGNEFDWANWEVQILFVIPNPTENHLAGPDTDTMTNCTANNAFWVQAVDFDNPVNGFPVFYFHHQGSINKIEHNGGTSLTLSDNWTFTKIVGRPTITGTFTEGTGFGAAGGCVGSTAVNNFSDSMQKPLVNGWLYGTIRAAQGNEGIIYRCNVTTGELQSLHDTNSGISNSFTI